MSTYLRYRPFALRSGKADAIAPRPTVIPQCSETSPWATSSPRPRSFDHLVGANTQRGRNFKPGCPGNVQIDHELENARLHGVSERAQLAKGDAGGQREGVATEHVDVVVAERRQARDILVQDLEALRSWFSAASV